MQHGECAATARQQFSSREQLRDDINHVRDLAAGNFDWKLLDDMSSYTGRHYPNQNVSDFLYSLSAQEMIQSDLRDSSSADQLESHLWVDAALFRRCKNQCPVFCAGIMIARCMRPFSEGRPGQIELLQEIACHLLEDGNTLDSFFELPDTKRNKSRQAEQEPPTEAGTASVLARLTQNFTAW